MGGLAETRSKRNGSGGLARLADMFKIGVGPSSSHTTGPMVAARRFVEGLGPKAGQVARISASLHGSLAWTGAGHWTDKAIALGLSGERPETLTPEGAKRTLDAIRDAKRLTVPGGGPVAFDIARDIRFDRRKKYDRHPNAMRFDAFDASGRELASEVWYSVGGGFVVREGEPEGAGLAANDDGVADIESLFDACRRTGQTFADFAMSREDSVRPRAETLAVLDRLADVMADCVARGLGAEGELPGGLKVQRRAKGLYDGLKASGGRNARPPDEAMRYVAAFAIAVNEENAAGNRIVTAPTNGAAGVIPAVLRYYADFCDGADIEGRRKFLLVAALVGAIIKRNASISGAEVGCQGEVGSAAAMAAAGLAAALGGSDAQIENAAEIAIEHHLGMTCDPVGGLVQIPCIERNAFGAIKAIAAASLALQGDGSHRVSLDQAIETMRQTGVDMSAKYRETSRGGLALNVPEC